MTSQEHAARADELLSAIALLELQMVERHHDEMARIRDSTSGVTANYNRSQEWTLKLAMAHAMTSLALDHWRPV